MPLAGRDAALKITATVPTTSTGEASTLTQSTVQEFVQIDDTGKRHWDPDSVPVLYLNSTAVSSTAYAVNYVQGKFEFTSTGQSAGTYTADVEYLTASNVAGGREWQLNVEADMFEITEFGSSGWKEYQPNLNGAQISISRYWNDSEFFDRLVTDNNKFVVELMVNSTGWRYEAFARIASDQNGAAVDSLVNESINLVADGRVYYSTG